MKNTRTLTAILLAGLSFMAAACNTVEGVGQDLESAGDKAEEVTRN